MYAYWLCNEDVFIQKEITLIAKRLTWTGAYAHDLRPQNQEKKARVKLFFVVIWKIIIHLYLVYYSISIIWLQYQFPTNIQRKLTCSTK